MIVSNPHFRGHNPMVLLRDGKAMIDRLSADEVAAFAATPDRLLWIETNILGPLNGPSICTDMGETLACDLERHIEERL